VWTQQGPKIVATDTVGAARHGLSVALSADGDTALIGGYKDNNNIGAAFVYTRVNGAWSQQGPKLVGSSAIPGSFGSDQGMSVALSSDGNIAAVGGSNDNELAGAVWIYTRANGVWTQQGSKLRGSGATGGEQQGLQVRLSSNGDTLAFSGPRDNGNVGAMWVFTRANGVWTQQGPKLSGTGFVGSPFQGEGLALSADGDTAFLGARLDNAFTGATWIFTRSNGVWSQRGRKLIGAGAIGTGQQGMSAALSATADTAIIGGIADNGAVGATWVYTRRAAHDFDGSGASDVLWRDSGGFIGMWRLNKSLVPLVEQIGFVPSNWSIVGQRDFDGDGKADILWRNTSGDVALWLMDGSTIIDGAGVGNLPPSWSVLGVADFDGDGKADILWRDANGDVRIWLMNGAQIASAVNVANVPVARWTPIAVGDFDGDGKSDIAWRDTAGEIWLWKMNGATIAASNFIATVPPALWTVSAAGDFNGDGKMDLMWRHLNGEVWHWTMDGSTITSSVFIANVPVAAFTPVGVGDFTNDGKTDVLWRETANGDVWLWRMDGGSIVGGQLFVGGVPSTWTIASPLGD
jgi:hypothetical protein